MGKFNILPYLKHMGKVALNTTADAATGGTLSALNLKPFKNEASLSGSGMILGAAGDTAFRGGNFGESLKDRTMEHMGEYIPGTDKWNYVQKYHTDRPVIGPTSYGGGPSPQQAESQYLKQILSGGYDRPATYGPVGTETDRSK